MYICMLVYVHVHDFLFVCARTVLNSSGTKSSYRTTTLCMYLSYFLDQSNKIGYIESLFASVRKVIPTGQKHGSTLVYKMKNKLKKLNVTANAFLIFQISVKRENKYNVLLIKFKSLRTKY